MKSILDEIARLRMKRGWSDFELSKRTGINQSSISEWYSKKQTPTFQNVVKVCDALGVTLSEFFAEDGDPISLTERERMLLDHWTALNPTQQRIIMELLESMCES